MVMMEMKIRRSRGMGIEGEEEEERRNKYRLLSFTFELDWTPVVVKLNNISFIASSMRSGHGRGAIRSSSQTTFGRPHLLNAVVVGASSRSTGEGTTEVEAGIHGNHLGEDLKNLLGDSLVVDGDQVLRLGVDLEGLVEGNGSLNLVVTY